MKSKIFENLRSEIQILKSLSHRHITKLVDIVVCGVTQDGILAHRATSAPRDTFISLWNTVQEGTSLITLRNGAEWKDSNTLRLQGQPFNTTHTHGLVVWMKSLFGVFCASLVNSYLCKS
jgi:serine/threonine protein kinase